MGEEEQTSEQRGEEAEAATEAEAAGKLKVGVPDPQIPPPEDDERVRFPEAEQSDELPTWVEIPDDLTIPQGAQVTFMRIKAMWTMLPGLGDRQCVIWPLTDLDERLAMSRIQGNAFSALPELAKQSVRAIDGVRVNTQAKSGEPGNLASWWREIGPKGRKLIERHYQQTHHLDAEETADFLQSCVVVRTMT